MTDIVMHAHQMTRTCQAWPANKRETRPQFLSRLRMTALRLPPAFVLGCFKNLKERCARLASAEGGLFEEGGH